jgi:RimJ/RimL family protein N-acetyltransferase
MIELRDGSRIVIRAIEPGDRAALAEAFGRLSPESRYRRFFAPLPELRRRDLDYLTRVDHRDHEALVAVDPATGRWEGVARYVRTGERVAEPAIVVGDEWQRRGVGTALLGALVTRAREEGIERFEAPVLAENARAIALLGSIGETRRHRRGREVVLSIDLSPSGSSGAARRAAPRAPGSSPPRRGGGQWPSRARPPA